MKLIIASLVSLLIATGAHAAQWEPERNVIWIPAIQWNVGGPLEYLVRRYVEHEADPSVQEWEYLPAELSHEACRKVVLDRVRDWNAVNAWKCTEYSQ